ncbi:MAG: hypothetical protein B5M49_04120, partial [Thermotoga sp. 4484_232]
DVEAGLIDFEKLKERFRELMKEADTILKEIDMESEDRVEKIIDYFFEREKREKFIKLFKQVQEIYEILSPDEFLRDYIEKYKLLVQIYTIIKQAYTSESEDKKIRRDLLKKTEALIRENVELLQIIDELPLYEINKDIANVIRSDNIPGRVKVINLVRSIRSHIEREKKEKPYLNSIARQVEEVIKRLEERQISIEKALKELINISEDIARAEEEQKNSGLSKEEFSYFWMLREKVQNPKELAKDIAEIFAKEEHWIFNKEDERELRVELYKKVLKQIRDIEEASELVEELLNIDRIMREGEE